MDVLGCKHVAHRGVAGEADRSGESRAHTLNSGRLLVKMQNGDTDPTPLHPASLCFSPSCPGPGGVDRMSRCPSCSPRLGTV